MTYCPGCINPTEYVQYPTSPLVIPPLYTGGPPDILSLGARINPVFKIVEILIDILNRDLRDVMRIGN